LDSECLGYVKGASIPWRPVVNKRCNQVNESLLVWVAVFGLMLAPTAVGCGKPNAGSLRGKVTFASQPLAGGQITFFAGDAGNSSPKTFPILSDGTFLAFDLPAGTLLVAIDTRVAMRGSKPMVIVPPNSRPGEGGGLPKEALVFQNSTFNQGKQIPEKYTDPRTSGLTAIVNTGKEIEKDFELD
jgi:hypothetical protein